MYLNGNFLNVLAVIIVSMNTSFLKIKILNPWEKNVCLKRLNNMNVFSLGEARRFPLNLSSANRLYKCNIWPNLNWWFLAASWLTVTSDCRRRWSQCSESFHMRSHTRKKREKSFAFMMLFCDHTTTLITPWFASAKIWKRLRTIMWSGNYSVGASKRTECW